MGRFGEMVRRLTGTLRQESVDEAMDEEFRFHVDMQTEANIRQGMSAEEARRAARIAFGGRELHKERARDEYRSRPLEDLAYDLRFGIRGALRSPLFSLLVIITLALGIGANAAVFSVVKSVLLDALPFQDADRLIRIHAHLRTDPDDRQGVSPGTGTDLRERLRSFERVAYFAQSNFDVTWAEDGEARALQAGIVGPGFFQTLGVSPVLGRLFGDDDAKPGAPSVIALSWSMWQREFGGDSAVIGRSLRLDEQQHEVVGVLPRGFVAPIGPADLWFPLDLTSTLADPMGARGSHWMGVIGRLRPGSSHADAERELAAMAERIAQEHPESDAGRTYEAVPLRDAMAGETRTPLIILLASAGLVLVITCANLGGALLSRALSRRKEFAVRVALGAGRGRVARQLLTESAILAVAGGAAGLLIAALSLAALRDLALPALPPYADLSIDWGVVLVTGLVALIAGVVFGLVPVLLAGRGDVQATLRDEGRGGTERRGVRHVRGALVAGQLALAVSLLAGAGLLVRSLLAIAGAPMGYDPARVLTGVVQLPLSEFPAPEARARLFEEYEARLEALPGVVAVASVSELPAAGMNQNVLTIENVALPGEGGQTFIPYMSVSHDYFDAMRIPLVRGRTFEAGERPGSPPAIVVSETMARRYWPAGNAIGARVRISPHTAETWGEIVGIVGDVRTDLALPSPDPMVYASNRQDYLRSNRTFLIRTAADPVALVAPVQRELAAVDPRLAIRATATLEDLIADGLAGRRLPAVLMTGFGLLALVLTAVGVYALFAAMVAAREREFGIRLALGASPRTIARLVIRGGAAWMGAGLALGAAGVVAVARLVRSMLYDVPALDPLALGSAVAILLLAAAIALYVPLRRAARVDPIAALR